MNGNNNIDVLPVVSIMIATYNSGWILSKALDAIRKQTYPLNKIELIIVDGGSTDDTHVIAEKYNCIILDNPKTEPVNAKYIGIREAKGKYFIILDHDEIMVNPDSILNKVNALLDNPSCMVATCSGYKRPEKYPFLNEYINEFGDPFSLFMYNFSIGYGFFEKNLRKHYSILKETSDYFITDFKDMKKQSVFELVCFGTMINREFFIKNTDILSNINTITLLFHIMLNMGLSQIAITKNDPLEHYSSDTLSKYLPKLKWRVCNNIHFPNMAALGFTGRSEYQKGLKFKKLLFLPYALTLILPFFQGIWLSLTRRNPVYLFHPILSFYVAIQIIYQYILKLSGQSPSFFSYDGAKKVE